MALVRAGFVTSKCPRFLDILPEQKNECPGTESFKMEEVLFLRVLEYAVKDADLSVVFKVGQVRALEAVYLSKDLLTELPIGYGKSLIFQLILVKAITFVWLCTGGVPCKLVLHFFLYLKICSLESWITSHSESVARKGIKSVVLRCGKLLKGQMDE